ncbi:MAG: hypothetical protein IKC01_06185 [Clostridia bacterium]|nr:hypothetical protein [Clostridia bacterium]
MTKKLISIIFAFILSISSVSILSVNASAANKDVSYNAESALKYAEANWNSGVGLCAEFASRCIQAGGINVFQPRVVNLYNALNGKYGTSHKLVLTGGTRGSLRMSDNDDKIGKGDLIFYFCNICKSFSHVVVCNGANSAGYIQDYAHNSADNGRKQTYTYGHCGGNNWTVYGIDLYDGPAVYGEKTNVGIPEISSVQNAESGVVVKWSAIKNADKYNVYRKTNGGRWQRLSQVKTTNYTDKTAADGVKYFYTVRAIDNNILSQYFDGESVISLKAPTVSVSNKLKSVTVKWTTVKNAQGYYVYKANAKNKWIKIATVKGGLKTSFIDENVENGKIYKYTVKAYSDNVSGAYSNKGSSITYVATPFTFTTTKNKDGLKISFSDIIGATRYRVYRKIKGESTWTPIGYSSTNSFVDKTGVNGKVYVYTARAINGTTYSGYLNNAVTCKYEKSANHLNSTPGKTLVKTVK